MDPASSDVSASGSIASSARNDSSIDETASASLLSSSGMGGPWYLHHQHGAAERHAQTIAHAESEQGAPVGIAREQPSIADNLDGQP